MVTSWSAWCLALSQIRGALREAVEGQVGDCAASRVEETDPFGLYTLREVGCFGIVATCEAPQRDGLLRRLQRTRADVHVGLCAAAEDHGVESRIVGEGDVQAIVAVVAVVHTRPHPGCGVLGHRPHVLERPRASVHRCSDEGADDPTILHWQLSDFGKLSNG